MVDYSILLLYNDLLTVWVRIGKKSLICENDNRAEVASLCSLMTKC